MRSVNKVTSTAILVATGLLVVGAASREMISNDRHVGAKGHHIAVNHRIMKMDFSLAKSFPSWSALKGAASLIVLGTAGAQHITGGSPTSAPWTTTTIHVERVVQGAGASTQTVLVRQLGGVGPDGTLWNSDDFPLLTKDGHYLLFLTPSPSPAEFYPVGAPQGIFTVSAAGRVSAYNAVAAQVGVAVQDAPLEQIMQAVVAAPAARVTP